MSATSPGTQPETRAGTKTGSSVAPQEPPAAGGWAVRWQQVLTADAVTRSDELLRRMQIDNPVRKLLAAAYTPADLWAVRVYSLAKDWSPALTVSQIYDKRCKQAQLAVELAPQHDTTGHLLAALAPEQAEAVLQLVLRTYPQAALLQADPLMQQADDAQRAAIEAIWQMIAGLRGHLAPAPPGAPTAPGASPPSAPDHEALQLWQTALAALQTALPPADFVTWLAPSMLLGLERDRDITRAVVGVPHIFAREHILTSYLTPLTQILTRLLGQPVTIQIEIDPSICAPPELGMLPATASTAPATPRYQYQR